ncbi:hypothetical protein ACOTWK_05900 [Aliarcobacter butzleri]
MKFNYNEWDFSEVSFGNSSLKIFYDSRFIREINVPCFDYTADNFSDSIVMSEDSIIVNDLNINVDIQSSNSGIYITLSSFEDDSSIDYDLFEIVIYEEENDEIIDEILKSEISLYVPVLSYTSTASYVIYGLDNEIAQNKQLLPLFYIEDTNRLEAYNNDELIDYKHFVDIFDIEDIVNKELREEQKRINVGRRKEKQKALKLDDPQKEPMIHNDIIDLYLNIEKKSIVIPVYQITDKNFDVTILKSDFEKFSKVYNCIALRIVDSVNFLLNLTEINESLKMFGDYYLIFDMNNNFNKNTIKNLINASTKKNVIYLGSNFESKDLTVSREDGNENHIKEDEILDIYFSLLNDFNNLGYGDYSGFDKKTITKFRGTATARVILNSLDKTQNTILLRRGWDERDKTPNPKITGYKFSMKRLLKDISENKIDKTYLDETICDADEGLKSFGETTTTPGNIKTLCLRHNIYSIIYRFMKN